MVEVVKYEGWQLPISKCEGGDMMLVEAEILTSVGEFVKKGNCCGVLGGLLGCEDGSTERSATMDPRQWVRDDGTMAVT